MTRGRLIPAAAAAVATLLLSGAIAVAASSSREPTAADLAALQYVNQHFREPVGLPDMTWNPDIAQAAFNHIGYWAKNGYSAHDETPGKPGFTGSNPSERCQAAGWITSDSDFYGGSCSEDAYPGLGIAAAVPGWMVTPYHGVAFFFSSLVGFATNAVGSVADFGWTEQDFASGVFDDTAPVNTPTSPVRIWPYDGATAVPVTFFDNETPDPLALYTGNKSDIGPAFFIGSVEPSTVTMTDSAGQKLPLLAAGTADAALALTTQGYNGFDGVLAWKPYLVATRLRYSSSYTLTVTTPEGTNYSTTFSTVKNPSPTRSARCTVTARRNRTSTGSTVSFLHHGTCPKLRVLVGVSGRPFRQVHGPVRLGRGQLLLWVAFYSGHQLAGHGTMRG